MRGALNKPLHVVVVCVLSLFVVLIEPSLGVDAPNAWPVDVRATNPLFVVVAVADGTAASRLDKLTARTLEVDEPKAEPIEVGSLKPLLFVGASVVFGGDIVAAMAVVTVPSLFAESTEPSLDVDGPKAEPI